MRGCGVAPEGVLGQKEADEEYVNGSAGEAETGVIDEVSEHERNRLMAAAGGTKAAPRYEEQRADDDYDSYQVPPDRDVVQDGYQSDAERVEQTVGEEDDRIHSNDVWRCGGGVEEPV